MAFRLNSGDVSALKCFVSLAVMYAVLSAFTYCIVHMKHVRPLPLDAPPDRYSEARAVAHVWKLAHDIGDRQEGRPGLSEAARYIKGHLEMLAERAGSHLRVEVDESHVSGSFNMMFLRHSISLGYKNHINVAMRISSSDSKDADPSVLVNGHFDSPLGSHGAADCASCVASMLEIARVIVDSGWVPPRPVILLFNGAEELFMLGSHGFMKTHRWRDSVGAFVNVEASGTGGLDLVCQAGPGSWPTLVYSQSAIYPMAHSAAQDVFHIIPGDTDYRIFAEDFGNIPGLDIIFLLGGYFYHTSYDTVERLLPGSMQARGENLFSLIKAFTSSSMLLNAQQRVALADSVNSTQDDRPVFFDYLTFFMISYPRKAALFLHSLPIVIFFVMPLFSHLPKTGVCSLLATFSDLMKGMFIHGLGIFLAILVPVIFAISRLLFSNYAMNWFAHPCLAFLMFVPSSLVGLLIPRIVWRNFPLSQDVLHLKTSKELLSDEARFWGAFGLYALITLGYLVAGLGGGFTTFFVSAFMLPAWTTFCLLNKSFGRQPLLPAAGYVVLLMPCIIYAVYFGGFLVQFLIEKMGMMGSLPHPYGCFVPDVIVAAITGVVTGWCCGPLIPIVGRWLARSLVVQILIHISVIALALSSQFFPYSNDAPKRLVLQHTFLTTGSSALADSSYEFSVVDANSLTFLFKHAPEAARMLYTDSKLPSKTANASDRNAWLALFPVSFLFSGSLKFPATGVDIFEHYRHLPQLSTYSPVTFSSTGSRKVYLEFSLGSLDEVWVSVLNITGPLSNWSFADNILPATEIMDGGPPSHILRLSGRSHENWTFWLETHVIDWGSPTSRMQSGKYYPCYLCEFLVACAPTHHPFARTSQCKEHREGIYM